MERAILLVECPDHEGIVAKVSGFVFEHGGNIIQSDQYSTDPAGGRFFMRLEFSFDPAATPPERLETGFEPIGKELGAGWRIRYASHVLNMGILVSKYDHCLVELLYRWRSGDLNVNIPLVASNHPDLRGIAEDAGIPFHHVPVTPDTKEEAEYTLLERIGPTTDFLVLARYMQILTDTFLTAYGKDIINIHHSFLPSFKGANPYRQAYERGVKVIGATAHYVTPALDEGPIIEQGVTRVSHKDNVDAMQRKGRHLEKLTLASAVEAHIEHRIIRYQNKTLVFD
jgi:formyltetrahydrofolate deformylase